MKVEKSILPHFIFSSFIDSETSTVAPADIYFEKLTKPEDQKIVVFVS